MPRAKKEETKVTIKEQVEALIEMAQGTLKDAEKFDGGTLAPGSRVRKAMQQIKAKAQEIRTAVTDAKNNA